MERIKIAAEQRAIYEEGKTSYEAVIAECPAKMEDLISKVRYTYGAQYLGCDSLVS